MNILKKISKLLSTQTSIFVVCIAIGFVLNYFFSKKAIFDDIKQIMPGFSVIGLALIVGGVVAYQGNSFFNSGFTIFIAVFLHNSLGYLTGKLFKFNKAKKTYYFN